jgi:hypothetical protein
MLDKKIGAEILDKIIPNLNQILLKRDNNCGFIKATRKSTADKSKVKLE